MKSLRNIVGILPVLCVIDPSFAALRQTVTNNTGRAVSVNSGQIVSSAAAGAARRIPTISKSGSKSTGAISVLATAAATTTKSTTQDASECIESYTDCIKGGDACGTDFEECVNTTLLHGKMPQCNSILMMCPSSAIDTLFGVSSVTSLGMKNTSTDEFIYPTVNSLMGQAVQAGEINNRLDTGSCVKKYTSCLQKDSVCGKDFELCTSKNEFKKQRVFCESTLARCQAEGKTELFGSATKTDTPAGGSRIDVMINDGADLAAVNAVSTCYKIVDNCFLSACRANPYRCIVGTSSTTANAAETVGDLETTKNLDLAKPLWLTRSDSDALFGASAMDNRADAKDISGYIQGACMSTIGSNKYCYATFVGDGRMPTAAQMRDEDSQMEVFTEAYNSRMANSAGMMSKIQDLKNTFDKKAKDACTDTIMKCAMRSCGGGLGSVCYKKSKGVGINGDATYTGIKRGCEAIVNTDPNCIYAAASLNEGESYSYSYSYNDEGAFTTLFPAAKDNKGDPISVIGKLNAALAENYNDAAIEKMEKSCRTSARSCIESMCGSDYSNCYRNRTDIMTDTYATGNDKFDKSMNKVGGILDFTVVRGLCGDSVKNIKACEEHFKIMTYSGEYERVDGAKTYKWQDSVSETWSTTAQGYSLTDLGEEMVESGMCTINPENTFSQDCKDRANAGMEYDCDTYDEMGCLYDVPSKITKNEYKLNLAVDTLFREVLRDAEQKAQAQYNAKLTKEQNKCLAMNNGGIVAKNDMTGRAYQWVKLKNAKVPTDYSVKGLSPSSFVASNDLYGSFCRFQVTVSSDEPAIQSYLANNKNSRLNNAYFATGDSFTCGSWIPMEDLEQIAAVAATKDVCQSLYAKNSSRKGKKLSNDEIVKQCAEGKLDYKQNLKAWLLSGAVGAVSMTTVADVLQTQTGLGGLMGSAAPNKKRSAECEKIVSAYEANKELIADADAGDTFSREENETVFGNVVYTYGSNSGSNTLSNVKAHNNTLKTLLEKKCGYKDGEPGDVKGWKRGVFDASLGIAGYVTAAGTAVGIMKAQNREEFTEAQKQWMEDVGSHIQCFVGGEEAGSYGDLVQITLDD